MRHRTRLAQLNHAAPNYCSYVKISSANSAPERIVADQRVPAFMEQFGGELNRTRMKSAETVFESAAARMPMPSTRSFRILSRSPPVGD